MNRMWSFLLIAIFVALNGMAAPPPNFFKQGMDHYNAGEYDAAIASFQKVVDAPKPGPQAQGAQSSSKKADALYYIGMCLMKKGNPGGAIANFTKSLNARPEYIQALAARGSAYVETKNFEGAIADLNAVLEAQPDNLEANYQIANAYSYQAKYAEAIQYYNKTLQLKPDHAYAHYWVGLAYYKTKDFKKTIDHFEKFLELAPDAPEAPQVKAILAQVQG